MQYDVRYVMPKRLKGNPREVAATDICNQLANDGWRLAHVAGDHIGGIVLFFEREAAVGV